MNGSLPERAGMRALHPNQLWVMRIRGAIAALVLIAAAWTADETWLRGTLVPFGWAIGAAALVGAFLVLWMPWRRYRAWGWLMNEEELHIARGVWTKVRTVVPFGRVQHIDVAQGPIERPFGLATLILHTAGTRGASVDLPGLEAAEAERMRDAIRARIRRDLL